MAKFAVNMKRTASATLSVGTVSAAASAMRRIKIYDVMVGSEGAPADVANDWNLARTTANGTNTAVTAKPLDLADAAFSGLAGNNHSVDATYSNAGADIMLDIALNQKASFRWVANPGGELVIPATASNGIGTKTPTAGSAVAVTCEQHIEEQ